MNRSVFSPKRWILPVFLRDTNLINARGKSPEMNRLEAWKKAGVILLFMPKKAYEEARQGHNDARTRKVFEQVYSVPCVTTQKERSMFFQIENTLFPNGAKNRNQKNDVEIVYTAWKYSRTLITNDGGSKSQPGGILGRKHQLKKLGVCVMSLSGAVKFIEDQIRKRDEYTKTRARETGNPLPNWVGKDLNPETT